MYLEFFKKRGHTIIPSSPLVPENDPTTLFTSSGMQPLVPYLLGQPHPEGKRLVDSQKSFRSQDIEEVGDNRHTTFFEMLGNWSLGDYFKKDQLGWFLEFLIAKVGLPKEQLAVTVFEGNADVPKDEESIAIWRSLGIPSDRVFLYGATKNWWSRSGTPEKMPAGEPGGPDSEVFFEFIHIPHDPAFGEKCHPNCDCGRFMEIGNSVFMQYQKHADGSLKEMDQQNVDFGGGLERILAAQAGDPDVFKIDILIGIITELERLSGKSYESDEKITRSMRVIADHVRAGVMLAADGVLPSNKQQGYFARRLLRRAIRFAHNLGITENFLSSLVPIVASLYQDAYPIVGEKAAEIAQEFEIEENKFRKTLAKGLREIEKIPTLDGHTAFAMYETYGFPLELTQEIATERGQIVDSDQFATEFQKHKDLSRSASSGMFKGGLADHSEVTVKYHTATHLLHAALRKILGTHVQQKGSNITGERLRFDFSHQKALSNEEKQQVEEQINAWIAADLPVHKEMMAKQEAVDSGAIAFFIEKYPDTVSVYTIGTDPKDDWISKELCGGPHVEHTGLIGPVKIFKEEAVSAGVRRIYLK
jgi:alanyl-tRNA synthetase